MKIVQTELPPGWMWKTMEEIADVVGGGTPKTNDPTNYNGGAIPWITPADLSGYAAKHIAHGARFITQKGLSNSSTKMMPAGTVLFTSRAPIGYVAIASNPVCTNQGFKSFVLKESVSSDYVYWWLKGSKDLAESMASGTTFLELSGAKAKQIPIPVAPLDQQKLIVAEIEKQFSRLDEAVANLKRVKANIKRYKAAVLKAAVEGRLVETEASIAKREGRSYETGEQLLQRILETRRREWKGKGKYKEPAGMDTADLPELPEGWVRASINQIAEKVVDGTHHTPEYLSAGVPFISVKDIRDNKVHFDDTRFISQEAHAELIKRCNPEPDDVLITKSGTIGRTAVILGNRPFSLFVSVALVKIVKPLVNSRFIQLTLDAYIQSIDISQDVKGGLLKNLHLEDLRVVTIPFPPLTEQLRIVTELDRRFSVIREVECQIDANQKRVERLRQSILSRAFSGRLYAGECNSLENVARVAS